MATAKPAAPAYRPPLSKVFLNVPELGVTLAVVVFFVAFALVDKRIGQIGNLHLMATEGSMVGLAAFGMSFLMIAGEIDLSAGATAGLCAVVAGMLRANLGWPELACYVTVVVLGALVGFLNSLVVLRLRMPAFFATLGASFLLAGLSNWLLKGTWIYMLEQIPLLTKVSAPSPILGLSWLFVGLLLAYIIGDLAIRFTILGPILTAVGGNRQAAAITGINVDLVKTLCFMFVGVCAALSGLAVVSYTYTADPTIGDGWLLWIIAIAIIGGGSLRGGVGSIIGALLGTVLVEIIRVGLFEANVKTNAQGIVIGAVLVGAAILDAFRRKSAQY